MMFIHLLVSSSLASGTSKTFCRREDLTHAGNVTTFLVGCFFTGQEMCVLAYRNCLSLIESGLDSSCHAPA